MTGYWWGLGGSQQPSDHVDGSRRQRGDRRWLEPARSRAILKRSDTPMGWRIDIVIGLQADCWSDGERNPARLLAG